MTKIAESERLLLRRFKTSDVEAYYQITRDKSIQDFVPYAYVSNYLEANQRIQDYIHADFKNNMYIAIEDKESKYLIGAILATRSLGNVFDIIIFIDIKHRNKGYMSEALSLFIPTMPHGSELIFVVDKCNTASYKTVTKLSGIKEKPFNGLIGQLMYRFSLIVE